MADDKRFSPTYYTRLTSPEWKRLCEQVKARAGYKCQHCLRERALQIHHRHYRTLGRETLDDLMAVCADCHSTMDANRDTDDRQRQAETRQHAKHVAALERRRSECLCPYEPCGGMGRGHSFSPQDTQVRFECLKCHRQWHDHRGDLVLWIDGREVIRPRRDDE